MITVQTDTNRPDALVPAVRLASRFLHQLPVFVTYTSNWFVDLSQSKAVLFRVVAGDRGSVLFVVATTAGCGTGDRASESLGAAGRSDRAGQHVARRTLCGRHVGAARADSGELVIADLARGRCGAGGEHSAGVRTASKDSRAKLVGAGYGLLLVMALVFVAQQQVTQCLMVAVVVSVCLAERTPLHPLLQWRPLAFIGVISYGVYFASSPVTGIVVPGHGPLQARSARRSSRPCCSGPPQRLPMPRATSMTPATASMTATICRRRARTQSCRYSMNACVFAGVAK